MDLARLSPFFLNTFVVGGIIFLYVCAVVEPSINVMSSFTFSPNRVNKSSLEDTLEIYNLQSRYQYYLTMYLGSRVEKLFAKKTKVTVVMNRGETWRGLKGVWRCFGSLDGVHATQHARPNGPND